MTMPGTQVRRANIDDIAQLVPLLAATHLPAAELEKRFTEFQVVQTAEGKLVAALGLQISQKHGRLHSESFADFSQTDVLRPLLWERIRTVAQNHGLVRLWTQETAPFWKQSGFEPATPDQKEKLPLGLGAPAGDWLTLKLKEDIEAVLSLDKEFAVFMQSEKARTEELLSRAKFFKVVAYLLGIALFVFSMGVLFWATMKRRGANRP